MNLVLVNFSLKDMIFNHDYCQKRKFHSLEDSTFENVDNFDTEYLTQDEKYENELLIDLIRSRLFLYDKKIKEFRNIIMRYYYERKCMGRDGFYFRNFRYAHYNLTEYVF